MHTDRFSWCLKVELSFRHLGIDGLDNGLIQDCKRARGQFTSFLVL